MIVRESFRRDAARLVIWYPVRWFIRFMPVRTAFAFFRCLGDLQRWLGKKSLHGLKKNIHRALPDHPQPSAVLKRYLRNHYVDRLHIFTYPRLRNPGVLETICRIAGLENLHQALAAGRGAIIVLGHYGPIQLPLFHLGLSGYSIVQVGLPTDEGLSWIGRHVAFRLRLRYEAMIPARILPADRFLRPLFHQLAENGIVMMNIDPAGGGRWIGPMIRRPFFGHEIPFPLGSALLSAKSGAPIVPLSITLDALDRAVCTLHPPLPPVERGREADSIATLAAWYEDRVRRDPGLWHFWDEYEPGKLLAGSGE